MRKRTLFAAAVVVTAVTASLLTSPASALRIPDSWNIGSSSSTNPNQKSGLSYRETRRKMRLEWEQRAKGLRPTASSSSTAVAGNYPYVEYTPGSLGKGQKAVLFFYSPWNLQCQGNDRLLKNWSKEKLFTLPVFKVQYDTDQAMRKAYVVLYANSFVTVDGKGNKIELLKSPTEAKVKSIVYGK